MRVCLNYFRVCITKVTEVFKEWTRCFLYYAEISWNFFSDLAKHAVSEKYCILG